MMLWWEVLGAVNRVGWVEEVTLCLETGPLERI